MSASDITIDDFKAYFTRDFPYYAEGEGGCPNESVTDADLQKAFDLALINFNNGLFADATSLKAAFLNLVAHYLCVDLQTAAQGARSVGYAPVTSRTVGAVSESYAIPDWVSKDPVWGPLHTTRYGQKYAAIVRPLCIGNVLVATGATTP
jgi:hypothetical protein